jgi:hypothetical protein
MRHPCPHPNCRDGVVTVVGRIGGSARRVIGRRRCPVCCGAGWVDEESEDLRSAGVVVWDHSDEDFRSRPTHWRP